MAAIAGALHVQLEKPDNYVVGDKIEELNANKIMTAPKIRNISIILGILVIMPLLFIVRLFFFPF
jgi:cobalamin biosynthesis protein CobD/CbiB